MDQRKLNILYADFINKKNKQTDVDLGSLIEKISKLEQYVTAYNLQNSKNIETLNKLTRDATGYIDTLKKSGFTADELAKQIAIFRRLSVLDEVSKVLQAGNMDTCTGLFDQIFEGRDMSLVKHLMIERGIEMYNEYLVPATYFIQIRLTDQSWHYDKWVYESSTVKLELDVDLTAVHVAIYDLVDHAETHLKYDRHVIIDGDAEENADPITVLFKIVYDEVSKRYKLFTNRIRIDLEAREVSMQQDAKIDISTSMAQRMFFDLPVGVVGITAQPPSAKLPYSYWNETVRDYMTKEALNVLAKEASEVVREVSGDSIASMYAQGAVTSISNLSTLLRSTIVKVSALYTIGKIDSGKLGVIATRINWPDEGKYQVVNGSSDTVFVAEESSNAAKGKAPLMLTRAASVYEIGPTASAYGNGYRMDLINISSGSKELKVDLDKKYMGQSVKRGMSLKITVDETGQKINTGNGSLLTAIIVDKGNTREVYNQDIINIKTGDMNPLQYEMRYKNLVSGLAITKPVPYNPNYKYKAFIGNVTEQTLNATISIEIECSDILLVTSAEQVQVAIEYKLNGNQYSKSVLLKLVNKLVGTVNVPHYVGTLDNITLEGCKLYSGYVGDLSINTGTIGIRKYTDNGWTATTTQWFGSNIIDATTRKPKQYYVQSKGGNPISIPLTPIIIESDKVPSGDGAFFPAAYGLNVKTDNYKYKAVKGVVPVVLHKSLTHDNVVNAHLLTSGDDLSTYAKGGLAISPDGYELTDGETGKTWKYNQELWIFNERLPIAIGAKGSLIDCPDVDIKVVNISNFIADELVLPLGVYSSTEISDQVAKLGSDVNALLEFNDIVKQAIKKYDLRLELIEQNIKVIDERLSTLEEAYIDLVEALNKQEEKTVLGIMSTALSGVGAFLGPFLPLFGGAISIASDVIGATDKLVMGDILNGSIELTIAFVQTGYEGYKLSKRYRRKLGDVEWKNKLKWPKRMGSYDMRNKKSTVDNDLRLQERPPSYRTATGNKYNSRIDQKSKVVDISPGDGDTFDITSTVMYTPSLSIQERKAIAKKLAIEAQKMSIVIKSKIFGRFNSEGHLVERMGLTKTVEIIGTELGNNSETVSKARSKKPAIMILTDDIIQSIYPTWENGTLEAFAECLNLTMDVRSVSHRWNYDEDILLRMYAGVRNNMTTLQPIYKQVATRWQIMMWDDIKEDDVQLIPFYDSLAAKGLWDMLATDNKVNQMTKYLFDCMTYASVAHDFKSIDTGDS